MDFKQIYKNNKTLMYKIIYKNNIQNINARVNDKHEIVVTAPLGIDNKIIEMFMDKHFNKFYHFIHERENNAFINLKQNYIHIKGQKYILTVNLIKGKQKYEIINNKIYLFLTSEDNKEKMIKKILHEVGNEYLINRAKMIAKKYGFNVNKFSTKWYQNKWGQCEFIHKEITLAIQLIIFNDEIIDYVIIHELCHLIFPNHSKEFWKKVESYYPQYKWAREKLKFQV